MDEFAENSQWTGGGEGFGAVQGVPDAEAKAVVFR